MKKGFTLLELLIVIAIIGILISLGVVSFTSAQKKSRDSRRRGDLKSMQQAWEQYYADSSSVSYPSSCSISATYLPGGIPTDPKGTAYGASCTSTSYCFCAVLESGSGNSDSSCNYSAATKTHYCVSQLQ